MIPAPKPKFSSPIWIDEIHKNKIFNKQKSVCNDPRDTAAADDEPQLPLTNGAIFLTEPLARYCNGDAVATDGDITPRRTRIRFPVRSISEILEFEDDDEVATPLTAAAALDGVKHNGVVNGSGSSGGEAALPSARSPSVGGGQPGRPFLQTDI